MSERPEKPRAGRVSMTLVIGLLLIAFYVIAVTGGNPPTPLLLVVGIALTCTGVIVRAIRSRS